MKGGAQGRKAHRQVLDEAKGYRGARSRRFRVANESLLHARRYAYRDRRARKGEFRKLWIQRINAAARQEGLTYSRLVNGLRRADVDVDRKVLADLAVHDPDAFRELVTVARRALP